MPKPLHIIVCRDYEDARRLCVETAEALKRSSRHLLQRVKVSQPELELTCMRVRYISARCSPDSFVGSHSNAVTYTCVAPPRLVSILSATKVVEPLT